MNEKSSEAPGHTDTFCSECVELLVGQKLYDLHDE